MKKIPSILKTIILTAVLSLGVSYAYAWTAPTATPPGDNVSMPLNVGSADQTKAGDVCTIKGGATKCLSTSGLPTATAAGQTVRWDGSVWGFSDAGDIVINGITVGKGGGNAPWNTPSTAIGYNALLSNTTGYKNTSVGYQALLSNTVGVSNTATGYNALKDNTRGEGNTANGENSLAANIDGIFNTAYGKGSLPKNINGGDNTAIGFQSLQSNIQGSNNNAIGVDALLKNTSGSYNVADGGFALDNNTEGSYNTVVGYTALDSNITGSNNTALGAWANVGGSALTNATAIGYGANVDASNKVRIGNSLVTVIGGQVAWSNLSDARLKKDIADYTHGLDFITKLRPVEFKFKSDTTNKTHSGFIAQEVEATGIPFYGINRPESKDGYYSLSYAEFVVPLVNSVKELKTENDKLRADNDDLRVRMERLEAKMK